MRTQPCHSFGIVLGIHAKPIIAKNNNNNKVQKYSNKKQRIKKKLFCRWSLYENIQENQQKLLEEKLLIKLQCTNNVYVEEE